MEEIIYSQNNNSTISCYSMDFSGISKQNAHGVRNVMPRCLSEGVDFFLKSVERQGKADTMSASAKPCVHGFWRTWLARVGDPVMMRTTVSLFIRKFTPGDVTSRRDVPFAMGVLCFENPMKKILSLSLVTGFCIPPKSLTYLILIFKFYTCVS